MKMAESDLYPPIYDLLNGLKYDVYPEVQPYQGWNRIDVFAKRPGGTMIVEMKTTLSIKVLDQAYTWFQEGAADYICIAVPVLQKGTPGGRSNELYPIPPVVDEICNKFGFGIITVSMQRGTARFAKQPRWQSTNREMCDRIESVLTDYHKEGTGGTQRGLTSFEITTRRLVEHLESRRDENLGDVWVLVSDVTEQILHHYTGKTPAATLRSQMEKYRNHLFEFKKIKKRIHIRLREGYKDEQAGEKPPHGATSSIGAINKKRTV